MLLVALDVVRDFVEGVENNIYLVLSIHLIIGLDFARLDTNR